MPSLKDFFFRKKKNKLHEFQCYENTRNPTWPPLPPPGQQNMHQIPHHPIQHSFPHHQPQFRQPQLHPQLHVLPQPQIMANQAQCQCQQCSYAQQQQQQHPIQTTVASPTFNNCISNGTMHHQLTHVQSLAPTQPQQQQIHQAQHLSHQPPLIVNQPPIMQQQVQNQVQPQALQNFQIHPQNHNQNQSQHPHQQIQQQQVQQSCTFSGASLPQHQNFVPQSPTQNQMNPVAPTPSLQPQCTCQHCPYQQQHPNQLMQQQTMQQQPPHQQQLQNQPPQPSAVTGQPMQPINSMTTNGTCQGQQQIYSNSYYNLAPVIHQQQQQQYHTINHQTQSQPYSAMDSTYQQQSGPTAILRTTTPGIQQTPKQTYECHTLQPQLYQQQKQQYQQQVQSQNHQRVQSLNQQHQQATLPMIYSQQQFNGAVVKSSHEIQSEPEQQVEQDGCSRYANLAPRQSPDSKYIRYSNLDMGPKLDDFREHIYCNESKKLPPYQLPPSYERFMASKKEFEFERNRQHMTHLSESMVWNRSRESGYENLRSNAYSNFGGFRQEAGLTS